MCYYLVTNNAQPIATPPAVSATTNTIVRLTAGKNGKIQIKGR